MRSRFLLHGQFNLEWEMAFRVRHGRKPFCEPAGASEEIYNTEFHCGLGRFPPNGHSITLCFPKERIGSA